MDWFSIVAVVGLYLIIIFDSSAKDKKIQKLEDQIRELQYKTGLLSE